MNTNRSRREFLALGLAVPATGLASATDPARWSSQPVSPSPASPVKFAYRTLGKTGLKVTTVGFGCMTTSDASVIERAADIGINYFDTARGYQGGNNERMVGAALKGKRKNIILSTKTEPRDEAGRAGRPRHQPPGARHRLRRHLVPARQEHAGGGHRRPARSPADRQEGRARSASPASARTRGTRS